MESTGKTFVIQGGGDPSVGIHPIQADVTFKDNIIWEVDMIIEMKLFLSEFYDVPRTCVLTAEEAQAQTDF